MVDTTIIHDETSVHDQINIPIFDPEIQESLVGRLDRFSPIHSIDPSRWLGLLSNFSQLSLTVPI